MRFGDRIAFRRSQEWQQFRLAVAARQDNKDYVTGEPLREDYNCHHLRVDQEHYDELDFDNFIAVNHDTHAQIHEMWNNGNTEGATGKLKDVFDRMDALNTGITRVLFANHIEYEFDESDKIFTTSAVKRLGIPNNRGWMYWNNKTPGCPADCPEDTILWIQWLREKYHYESLDTLLALELRHLCLWSSLKNLQRPDVRKKNPHWKEQEELLLQELPKTTNLIKKYLAFLGNK